MSQPFYQPARQNFSSSQSMQQPQGGFGGFGGGYQMPQQSFGGGFGGGYGSGFGFGGGFQPSFGGGFGGGYGSGFGGFQPQQQFNPYQGGFGGFGGFGGGYNPMFGGIGGLGFNPMMGPQFGMPMQGMGGYGGFNPYQPPQQEDGPGSGMGGFADHDRHLGLQGQLDRTAGMTPQQRALFMEQEKQNELSRQAASGSPIQEFLIRKQSGGLPTGFLDDVDTRTFLGLKGDLTPEQKTQRDQLASTLISKFADAGELSDYEKQKFATQEGRYDWNYGRRLPKPGEPGYAPYLDPNLKNFSGDAQTAYWAARTPPPDYAQSGGWGGPQRQPMYGGLGSLGFNPMMGPQFGMPMGQDVAMSQDMVSPQMRSMAPPPGVMRNTYHDRPQFVAQRSQEEQRAIEDYLRTWDAGRAALGAKQ